MERVPPRLLLAEDDPVSAGFLIDASQSLPADVDLAGDCGQAMKLARQYTHALWLFDAHLPDGRGNELLLRLRAEGLQTPALAHTASADPQQHAQLRAAGFLQVLVKPIGADAWCAALRAALAGAPGRLITGPAQPDEALSAPAVLPVWDDAVALAALGGNADNVVLLRQLFLAELPGQRLAIQGTNPEARQDTLHRLRASCALVGAMALAHAAGQLQQQASPQAMDDVLEAIAHLLSLPQPPRNGSARNTAC